MTICLCCLVPVIIKIRYVLFGLSFSLLDSIKNKISVRQSLKVGSDSRAFHYGNMGIGGGGVGARGHMHPRFWIFFKFRYFMASRLFTICVK